MFKKIKLAVLSAALLLNISCQQKIPLFLAEYTTIDLLITNGNIIDGLGNKPIMSDLVIVGDEIKFIGKTQFTPRDYNQRIQHHIDAKGLFISPGFIDLHSHGDPLATPDFKNFLAMGVTTITLGQDGDSPTVDPLSDWLKQIEKKGIAINLAMLVGHGTLRQLTGINQEPIPTQQALNDMLQRLDNTLKYTFGLSTGLEYNPGLYAQQAELNALAKIVGKNNRVLMSHMRNEDSDQLEKSINELLIQGQFCKVHISHIKSVYGKGADEADAIVSLLQNAKNNGINITADIYPYNASYAGISLLFPVWAKTTKQFKQALKDRREELATFLRNKIVKRNGVDATLFGTTPYSGKTLGDLATEFNIPYEEVLIKLGPQGASAAYFIMDERLQSRLLLSPNISISSDGSPHAFHPRGYGTFAKIIEKYVNQQGVLPLTEAIRKMTSQSANILGINDRGVIKVGKKADIIIFDLNKVKANASYTDPHRLAEGFSTVIVNGKIAKNASNMIQGYYGKVLQPD